MITLAEFRPAQSLLPHGNWAWVRTAMPERVTLPGGKSAAAAAIIADRGWDATFRDYPGSGFVTRSDGKELAIIWGIRGDLITFDIYPEIETWEAKQYYPPSSDWYGY